MIKSYVNTFIDYFFPKEMQILMHFAALIKVAREFDKKNYGSCYVMPQDFCKPPVSASSQIGKIPLIVNSSPPGHFADIFKCIFMNEKLCILVRISLKFVPKGPIDNKSALVQVLV